MSALTSSGAFGGVWSELPEATSRLQRRAQDRDAEAVLAAAERMVIDEAAAGRLDSATALMEVYAGLVVPLADGDLRVERLGQRVTNALQRLGDRVVDTDRATAGRAWSMAASIDPRPDLVERLARITLPPADPADGQSWRAPIDGVELVWHPGLEYRLGCSSTDRNCQRDERFFRWVAVEGAWVERSPVTNARYEMCVHAGACTPAHDVSTGGVKPAAQLPVVGVTWRQARDFAHWAGRRLPSEAEWERAARGRAVDARFPWGNRRSRERANVLGADTADTFEGPSPVGSFPANGYGMVDMAGNVWEWVEDRYHRNALQAPKDGRPWTEGGFGRVQRGGSWRQPLEAARVSAKSWQDEDYYADDAGFRCVMGGSAELTPAMVVARAQELFPVASSPNAMAANPTLDAADRHYLERRTMIWLVLEGRAVDGVPHALHMLEGSARDPVALDLLDRADDQLKSAAESAELGVLEAQLATYRNRLQTSARQSSRIGALEVEIVERLKTAGQRLLADEQYRLAEECFRFALQLRPQDKALARMVKSAEPAPGESRLWPRDGREMVWIPSGAFLMGASAGDRQAATDEHPASTVSVRGFWLDRSEVTNAQYRSCVDAGACSPPARTDEYDTPELADHPVIWVSWYQARVYAQWAGKRLPSEAERERAARLGRSARYPWGEQWVDGRANVVGIAGADRWVETSPVGSFAADEWGLLDMIGNAWEWVDDVHHSDYRGRPRDGRPWTQTTDELGEPKRVLRGGSYLSQPAQVRVSQRDARAPDNPSRSSGFRCAADG